MAGNAKFMNHTINAAANTSAQLSGFSQNNATATDPRTPNSVMAKVGINETIKKHKKPTPTKNNKQ